MMPRLSQHEEPKPGRAKGSRKGVRIGRTHVGRGVFAQQRYVRGGLVGEVQGKVIDEVGYGSDYCMDLGDTRCLEPSAPFRYLNHSCEPNCCFDWYDLPSTDGPQPQRRIFVTALADIKPGEELTIDYGWPAESAIPCRCRAPSCRGWIVATEELPDVLQRQAAPDA